MVRGFAAVAAVLFLTTGALVSWAPAVDANCDKSYPPCICANAARLELCSGPPWTEVSGVNVAAELEESPGTTGGAYAIFEFAWAEDASARSSVRFDIDLEGEGVEFRDAEDFSYTHVNDTAATVVKVYQAFSYEGSMDETEVRFTLTANAGTPDEESVEGTLGFETAAHGNATAPDAEMDSMQLALVSGAVGAMLGALLVAVVMMVFRK